MMSIRSASMGMILTVAILSGCGSGRLSESERMEKNLGGKPNQVTPVKGKITVDGEPGTEISILLYSSDGTKLLDTSPRAISNDKGEFIFTTYKNGDGIEPGDYKLTFDGRKFKRSKGDFSGKDKLNGRFANPLKSQFKLTVTANEPQTDVVFELKTK